MEFRDIEIFNKAILTKHWWKLMQDSNYLVGRFIKKSTIKIVISLGQNLGTLHHLFGGVYDKNIYIWGANWIPHAKTFKVKSPVKILQKN